MKAMYRYGNCDYSFTDNDIVNLEDWIPDGEYNPYMVRPHLIHEAGYTLGVVFAENLQDALDKLAYAGKLDEFLVENPTDEEYDTYASLGGAGELFDLGNIEVVVLPNPRRSFVAQFNYFSKKPEEN